MEFKCLLEHVTVGGIVASESSLPQLVEGTVLDEEDWFNRGVLVNY